MKHKNIIYTSLAMLTLVIGVSIMNKKNAIENIINKLKYDIVTIKNIKLSLQNFKIDIQIRITNPTTDDLYVNSGVVKAKILRIYQKHDNALLAVSPLNMNVVNIPSGANLLLPTTSITLPLISSGKMILTQLLNHKKGSILHDITKQLKFEIDIEIFEHTKTISF